MVVATSSRALTGVAPANVHLAAAANPASTSDGNGDNSNPYAIIIDRNIFRLNPPPPPPVAAVKPVDVPKVYLNGILKNGDDVRVLFSIPPKDGKSQTSYFKLAPGETASGEKEDVLELVRIHPDQQEVDVVVNGTAETLSVLSNSLASAGGNAGGGAKSAPAPAPAALIANAPSSVVVGGDRSASRYGGGGGGGGGVTVIGGGSSSSLGGGSGVLVGNGSGGSPTAYGGGVSVSGGNGVGQQIASALMSGTPNQGQIGSPQTEPAAPPEQQMLGLLLDHTKNPNGPPLPPPLAEMVGENTGITPPTPGGRGSGAVGAPPPVP